MSNPYRMTGRDMVAVLRSRYAARVIAENAAMEEWVSCAAGKLKRGAWGVDVPAVCALALGVAQVVAFLGGVL